MRYLTGACSHIPPGLSAGWAGGPGGPLFQFPPSFEGGGGGGGTFSFGGFFFFGGPQNGILVQLIFPVILGTFVFLGLYDKCPSAVHSLISSYFLVFFEQKKLFFFLRGRPFFYILLCSPHPRARRMTHPPSHSLLFFAPTGS